MIKNCVRGSSWALLVILGVTLYVGGWMYRKVDLIDTKTVTNN